MTTTATTMTSTVRLNDITSDIKVLTEAGNDENKNNDSWPDAQLIYGIVLGIVVLILAIAITVLIICILRNKKKRVSSNANHSLTRPMSYTVRQVCVSETPNSNYTQIGSVGLPDTVYAEVVGSSDRGSTIPVTEKPPKQMIYAELEIASKKDEDLQTNRKSSKQILQPSETEYANYVPQ